MIKKITLAFLLSSALFACKKVETTADPIVPTVPERLEISPATSSILTGQTAQFTLKFYNNVGVLTTTPAGIVWSSDNTAIVSVNQSGLASAVSVGLANIKATYNNISISAALTVVVNNNVLSTVTLSPTSTQEILLNASTNFTGVGTNLAGGVINGLNFTWASTANTSVQVNNTGMVTGLAYGSANITATANGITSTPVMVQVIRQGNFTLMNSTGIAKLKIENGTLKLQTSASFYVNPSPPDLRIYLSNSATSITNALQVAPLSTVSQTSGMRSWNLPATTTITQYRYAVVWCAQFGGVYGVADFGI